MLAEYWMLMVMGLMGLYGVVVLIGLAKKK